MVQEADVNNTGTIELSEFVAVMNKHRADNDPSGWGRLNLYEQIGGHEVIEKIVDTMYESLAHDQLLHHHFMGINIKRIV
jgi:hypothetical protein